jgi:hypothetical protein
MSRKKPAAPEPATTTGFEHCTTRALQEVVYHRDDPHLRCRILPPDLYFRPGTDHYARFLCSGCPITGECLELSLREECEYTVQGIRGGRSPKERRAMLRQRNPKKES